MPSFLQWHNKQETIEKEYDFSNYELELNRERSINPDVDIGFNVFEIKKKLQQTKLKCYTRVLVFFVQLVAVNLAVYVNKYTS